MPPVIDLIAAIRQAEGSGSRSERRLAAMMLADLDFASRGSIIALAERAGVSEPTVTRFCRAVGCEGIRDFKFRLAQAIAVGGAYLSAREGAEADERRFVDQVADGAIGAIERLRAQIDPIRLREAATRIARARQVLVFGSGGSSSIAANETQHRLFRLGIAVTAYSDGELQRMTASVAQADTVVVAFSISGFVRPVIEATAIARAYGATTIAVTAPGSALAEAAETVISFAVPEDDQLLFRPSPARYALLGIVDMLASATAETLGPRVLEGLRRIKQSLNTLKVNDPRLPLGD